MADAAVPGCGSRDAGDRDPIDAADTWRDRDLSIAINRTVLVAVPASFSATVVDTLT